MIFIAIEETGGPGPPPEPAPYAIRADNTILLAGQVSRRARLRRRPGCHRTDQTDLAKHRMQIAGRPLDETMVLRIAAVYERGGARTTVVSPIHSTWIEQ